jgi:DNA-binding transcriptional ArsR family regulator
MISNGSRTQRLLACLGDPSRFRVAATLLLGECCVTDLAAKIGLSQSCTTRHLQALQREGLVCGVRDGKRMIFRLCLDEPQVTALVRWALSAAASDGSLPAPAEAVLRHEWASGRPGETDDRVLRGDRPASSRPRSRRGVSGKPGPERRGASSRRAQVQPPAGRPTSREAPTPESVPPNAGQQASPARRDELEDYLL